MKLLLLNFVYAYEAVNVCLRREFQQHSVRQYLTSSRSLYKAVGPRKTKGKVNILNKYIRRS